MLIYEKVVNGVRHLFGASSNIPSSTDTQVTYVDDKGTEVTPSFTDSFVDDGNGGIVRVSDKTFVAAFVGSECVIPNKNWQPKEQVKAAPKRTSKPKSQPKVDIVEDPETAIPTETKE